MALKIKNNSGIASAKFLNKIHNKPIKLYSNKFKTNMGFLEKNSLLHKNKKIKKFKQQIHFFLNLNATDLKNKLFKLSLKTYIKLKKKKNLLIFFKLNPNFLSEKLKKKFLDLYLKNFILDRYSLINLIKKKNILKKKKNVLLINIRSNNVFINFLSYKKKKKSILIFGILVFLNYIVLKES